MSVPDIQNQERQSIDYRSWFSENRRSKLAGAAAATLCSLYLIDTS
jgi:hypothetical protein